MNKEFNHQENYIYKYVPFSMNTLKMLIKGELWFGFPNNLNDPFEGEFLIDNLNSIPDDEFLKAFYSKDLKIPDHQINKKLKEIKKDSNIFKEDVRIYIKQLLKNEYGVSCFSSSATNILMWSHYADSHKGLCLVFDKNELIDSVNLIWNSIKMDEINYKPYLPKVNLTYENNQLQFTPNEEIFLRKLDDWKKEDEVRFYFHFEKKNARRFVPFDKSSLKGIILGENLEDDNLNTILHLIGNDSKYNINLCKASKDLFNKTMKLTHVNYGFNEKLNMYIIKK